MRDERTLVTGIVSVVGGGEKGERASLDGVGGGRKVGRCPPRPRNNRVGENR